MSQSTLEDKLNRNIRDLGATTTASRISLEGYQICRDFDLISVLRGPFYDKEGYRRLLVDKGQKFQALVTYGKVL